MNVLLILLAIGTDARTCATVLNRLFLAIGIFSLELQAAALTHVGSARSLVVVNAVAALLGLTLWRQPSEATRSDAIRTTLPWAMIVAIGTVVVLLDTTVSLPAADPYHLLRVAQIERLGTLAFDPAVADVKVNILAGVYELVLADLHALPLVGGAALRVHGLVNLLLYLLAIGAAFEWLGTRSMRGAALLLSVPVVFHQFILVKNDLFAAVPAFAALAWLVARADTAPAREIAWAGFLAGFAVGVKVSMMPVAVVMGLGLAVIRARDWRGVLMMALAGVGGAASAGLFFTLAESIRVYGSPISAYAALGNRNVGVHDMLLSVGRFVISLGDLGLVTRAWWPGRGGWGGTMGLPLIWAIALLLLKQSEPFARRALWIASGCFVMFAAGYPDADIAHRLMLAPGLLLISVAIACSAGTDRVSVLFRQALPLVVVASSLQIARSAVLYAVSP